MSIFRRGKRRERVNVLSFETSKIWLAKFTIFFNTALMSKKRTISHEEEDVGDTEIAETSGMKTSTDITHVTREVLSEVPLVNGQSYLKIMSWNVNGLRALATKQKDVLLNLVEKHHPDILCLQVI